jgi:hypothetical protein
VRRGGQVLTGIKHGGHILEEDSARVAALASEQESITLVADAAGEVTFETPFDYRWCFKRGYRWK